MSEADFAQADPVRATTGSAHRATLTPTPHVVIIVQNLPVPFDRRVWLECQALRADGFEVSVVCPKGPGDPDLEVVDGVSLYKYRAHGAGKGKAGFLVEYVSSFAATAWLVVKIRRQRGSITVLQACNPPDIFWPIALVLRAREDTRFVFDHHDLCPELYESRFPGGSRLPYWGLRILEWCTFHSADRVVSTNASYQRVAIERGGKDPSAVTVVRTGPDAELLRRGKKHPALKRGRRFLVAYLGVMGPQDGADNVVRCAEIVARQWGRSDVAFTLMGSGDCFDDLIKLRDELCLQDVVEFTGRVPDDVVYRILSTADVGLSPDPKNPLNDVSTMNKTMEYMSFSLPIVAFDLHETRVSAGEAAIYARPGSLESFARALIELLDDEARRQKMALAGRMRIEEELAWIHQRQSYLQAYWGLVGEPTDEGERLGCRNPSWPVV